MVSGGKVDTETYNILDKETSRRGQGLNVATSEVYLQKRTAVHPAGLHPGAPQVLALAHGDGARNRETPRVVAPVHGAGWQVPGTLYLVSGV